MRLVPGFVGAGHKYWTCLCTTVMLRLKGHVIAVCFRICCDIFSHHVILHHYWVICQSNDITRNGAVGQSNQVQYLLSLLIYFSPTGLDDRQNIHVYTVRFCLQVCLFVLMFWLDVLVLHMYHFL